ncbi:MAG TPA: RluA family pseudouridine synthase [Saprospiraceae bacterium]|nr:RluA family pseudouridine synthase [Saprospiraceae bacterium]
MKEKSEILFENKSVVAVNKPSGILSVPDRYNADRFSIANWILSSYPQARPLHRIDFETSGVLLFCILPESFGWYSDQFENRKVVKTYHAIVEGRMSENDGLIDQPLYTLTNGKVIISKRGKESQTKWNTLERFLHHSYVSANPLTGRTHQIRVHLSFIGHPLVGDISYGSTGPLYLSSLKGRHRYHLSKDEETERPLIARTALHAARIEFSDFHSQLPVSIECPLPKDMNVILQKLRQYTPVIERP